MPNTPEPRQRSSSLGGRNVGVEQEKTYMIGLLHLAAWHLDYLCGLVTCDLFNTCFELCYHVSCSGFVIAGTLQNYVLVAFLVDTRGLWPSLLVYCQLCFIHSHIRLL